MLDSTLQLTDNSLMCQQHLPYLKLCAYVNLMTRSEAMFHPLMKLFMRRQIFNTSVVASEQVKHVYISDCHLHTRSSKGRNFHTNEVIDMSMLLTGL